MTTISIVDAAILSHLSKQPSESQRLNLTKRLSPAAKGLAVNLKRTNVKTPTRRASARVTGR
jgi:hypothetical protein